MSIEDYIFTNPFADLDLSDNTFIRRAKKNLNLQKILKKDCVYNAGVRESSYEERLLAFLFEEQDYNTVARAVMDTTKTVTVSLDFVLLRMHGLVSL